MKKVKLGDVCKVLNGFAFKSENYVSKGIRIIRISNVQKGRIEDLSPVFYPFDDKNALKYSLSENDILISLTGNVGRVAQIKKPFLPAALNQRVACLKINDENILYKEYLFNYLNFDSFENRCISSSKGVAQKNMSTEWLKEQFIPLPPMEEQKKIASVMDKISDLIDKRRRQLEKLDLLVKSQFIEMFGDGHVEESSWKTDTFENIFEISSSKRILKTEWISEGIPFLRVRDMVQLANGEPLNNEFFVSEQFYSNMEEKGETVKAGDIIVSATSTIGKTYVIKDGEKFYFKDADVLQFRKKVEIDSDFFAYGINMPTVKEQIDKGLGGTTVKHFIIANAKKIVQPLPPVDLQRKFVAVLKQTNKSKFEINKSLEKLETLKKSLMQKYFG